jgi:mannitol-specific phosphotransferase system IIBC component
VQETENLVVTAGKNWVADRMNNANTVMTHMAVGTGTNAAAAGDTTLQTENDRNALTSTTVTNNAIAYVATWAAGDATAALTEAGILDAASGGDLLARTVFSVVNKGAADSMTITWTITVS